MHHTLTARYGLSFYDEEALAIQMYGSDADMAEFQARRRAEWYKRLEGLVCDRLDRATRHLARPAV